MKDAENYRKEAKEIYEYATHTCGEIQIDEDAAVVEVEGGVWVQAWVWVNR